jgi:hypothetical protein
LKDNSIQADQVIVDSPSPSVLNLLKISGGELGKSGPGARGRADGRIAANNKVKPAVLAEALQNPYKGSRTAAANRLGEELQGPQDQPK